MPTCELITIGSELLNGSVLNTNAQFLSRKISGLCIDVTHQVTCRDRIPDIVACLDTAFRRSRLVVVTGGLGPTPDDVTREAIAQYFGSGLKFDSEQYRHIVKYFRSLGRGTPPITRREAFLPEIAKPLVNRFGIALGFYIWKHDKLIVVLPGVPMELKRLYDYSVGPLIKKKLRDRPRNYTLLAKTIGLNEPEIMRKLGRSFFRGRAFDFGIYPKVGEVAIRLRCADRRLMTQLKREITRALRPSLYSFSEESISVVVGKSLVRKRSTIAVAESCTGGLLAKILTDVPGSSRYFLGGIVAYANKAKIDQLGVLPELLRAKGAVSREVAQAMALGVRLRFHSSLGLSITGIAGPDGGTRTKPVGLVLIGVSDRAGTRIFSFRFSGDRSHIRRQAVSKAMLILWRWFGS